jgi:hypothetical protein
MTICQVDTVIVAKDHGAGDDARTRPMFPELFRTGAVGMRHDRMLFQGYEWQGNQDDPNVAVIKKEWAVQVTVAPPADLAQSVTLTARETPPKGL